MTKINLFGFLFLFAFIGCSTTYKLEQKSMLSFNESYYNLYSAAVKGGGGGYNVYLIMNEDTNFDKKKIKVIGIYFKEKYTKIKHQGLNKYQAFIKQNANTDQLEFESDKKVKTVQKEEEKIPFTLKDNEAVISYLIKDNMKYVKIILTQKETEDFPM
jgi:hypothetical protein